MMFYLLNRLQHTGVFDLIHKHNLYDVIHDKIEGLMDLDASKAISMLIEKEHVSPDIVIKQLELNKLYLFIVSTHLYFIRLLFKKGYDSFVMLPFLLFVCL